MDSHVVEWTKDTFYDHSGDKPERNINDLLKAFWGDAQGATHLGCVISCVGATRKVSGEQNVWA